MQLAWRIPPSLALISTLALVVTPACKGDSGNESSDETGGSETIYDRLGQEQGIEDAVTSLVVNRIAPDPRINAYFFNSEVDVGVVINCLTLQLSSLTGGPQEYPGDNCRDMKTSHWISPGTSWPSSPIVASRRRTST
jgi:hypothetical protein